MRKEISTNPNTGGINMETGLSLRYIIKIVSIIGIALLLIMMINAIMIPQNQIGVTKNDIQIQTDSQSISNFNTLPKNQIEVNADNEVVVSGSTGSEPQIIHSPVHVTAASPDGEWMVVGTRTVQNSDVRDLIIHKWNGFDYDEVGRLGSPYHEANVLDIEITDLDKNGEYELILASSDGYVYIFSFNLNLDVLEIDLLWQSIFVVNAFDIDLVDVDGDGIQELLVAAWTKYAMVYGIDPLEYDESIGFWNNYHERWRSDLLKSQVLSITSGLFDDNEFLDIIVGSRDGSLIIFEDTNNYNVSDPEYLCDYSPGTGNENGTGHGNDEDNIFDLCFAESWTETNMIWTEILQLDAYDIDQDTRDELAILTLGENVFLLNFEADQFILDKITSQPQIWEQSGTYPIDNWVDEIIDAQNITFNGVVPEPMSWLDPANKVSPFRSGMVNKSLGHFSQFSDKGALAILDFGLSEEIVAGGNSLADVLIHLEIPYNDNISGFQFSIGVDSVENITDNYISYEDIWMSDDNTTIFIDLDPYFNETKFNNARFAALMTHEGFSLSVKYIEAVRINLVLDSVRSILFDTLLVDGTELPALIVSHSQGNIETFIYEEPTNAWGSKLVPYLNSYEDQEFLLDVGGIWDLHPISGLKSTSNWNNPNSLGSIVSGEDLRVNQVTTGPLASDAMIDGVNEIYPYIVFDDSKIIRITSLSEPIVSKTDPDQEFSNIYDHYSDNDNEIRIAFANLEINPDPLNHIDYSELIISTNSRLLDIWNFDGITYNFLKSIEINFTDTFISEMDNEPIEITTGDITLNGWSDLVVSNRTHIEFFEFDGENLTHIPEYFDMIEYDISRYGFHQYQRQIESLQMIDFDGDNDLDIQFSYYERPGFSYFENSGSPNAPKWIERRDVVHYRQPENAFTNFDYEFGLFMKSSTGSWTYFTIDNTNNVVIWNGAIQETTSYIAVGDGKVSVLDINLSSSNWGYQYHEHSSISFAIAYRSSLNDCSTLIRNLLLDKIIVTSGDSDGDGIIDGLEGFSRRNSQKTAISDPDTDGDGLSDKFELTHNLNPRDHDSNHNLIPDGIEFYQKSNLTICHEEIDENYNAEYITGDIVGITEPTSEFNEVEEFSSPETLSLQNTDTSEVAEIETIENNSIEQENFDLTNLSDVFKDKIDEILIHPHLEQFYKISTDMAQLSISIPNSVVNLDKWSSGVLFNFLYNLQFALINMKKS